MPASALQSTPRGVQIHLGTGKQAHMVDTLVMSNLGYFQLKAAPGMYNLSLAPGRSEELYTVVNNAGTTALKGVSTSHHRVLKLG